MLPISEIKAKKLSDVADKFDSNNQLLPEGMAAQTVTVVSATDPTPSYIGQPGRDILGKRYRAIALTGTMWEEDTKSYFTVGKNLFNKNTIIEGYFVNQDTGLLSANASYDASDFIPVVAGQTYIRTNGGLANHAWYDSDYVFISGSTSVPTLAPAGAKWLRFSLNHGVASDVQFEIGTIGSIYESFRYEIDNESNEIEEDDATFFVSTKNLFNKHKIKVGYLNSWTTGAYQVGAAYDSSDFIPVSPETNYVISGTGKTGYWAWYDADKAFLSGHSSGYTHESPANAAYIRFSFLTGTADTIQFEIGVVGTDYVPYKIIDGYLLDNPIDKDKLFFYERTKNLFNKDTVTTGYFASYSTGALQANANLDASDFIPVVPETDYYISGYLARTPYVAWYDSDRVFISGSSATYGVTSPVGAAYVRIAVNTGLGNRVQFEAGTARTYYLPYYKEINDNHKYPFRGSVIATMGDSITALDSWQPYIAHELQCDWVNYGEGGTRISGSGTTAMCNDARIDAIDADSSIIIVMGGTNDWFNNVALDTIGSTDVTKFYGALNVMCQKLTTRFPAKKIVLLTTPYGIIGTTQTEAASQNSLGLTCADYGQCIINVGKKWGLPVVDILSGCGWNYVNISTFVTNDGNYLHPNYLGSKRLADAIINSGVITYV